MDTSSNSPHDPIASSLGLAPLEKVVTDVTIETGVGDTTTTDFEYARGNMINIIEKGSEALDGIMQVAGMSQHPRSYEVVANLIKTMADANKDLLELSKKRKELTREDPSNGPKTVNQNLFVGSTAELQKFLKGQSGQE